MFERFTDRARRVVVLAQEEARELNHNYIGTEHILLGLLREKQGVAGQALQARGVTLEDARLRVAAIVSRGTDAPSGHIPFTPRAKKVLELSLREAMALGHEYIGTEHILLGLIREGEGVASHVLTDLGAGGEQVREKVIELLHSGAGETAPSRGPGARMAGSLAQQEEEILARLAAIDARLAGIERHLGIGSGPGEAAGPGEPAAG